MSKIEFVDNGINMWGYRTFSNEQERKEALQRLVVNTGALSSEVYEWLVSSGFLTAPASTKYHGAYEGGLFDHSYTVATALIWMTDNLELEWDDEFSPIRVGLFHDLCKIDQYDKDSQTGQYFYRRNTLITGHGIKSALIAQSLPENRLNAEEVACIVYHMGAFTDKEEWNNYTNAIKQFPNVLWTHTADMLASQVLEVNG